MTDWEREIEAVRGPDFAGLVSVVDGDGIVFEQAYGLADRAHAVPMTSDMQFAVASATKGLTAVLVMSLVADGVLTLETPARELLGEDLPLIDADVTVDHLLTHTSGIGDYCDEDLPDEQPLQVPVYALDSAESYLPALDGFAPKFAAGSRFSYCNSGYAVLALIAGRAAGRPFATLIDDRVLTPAGMADTAFLRSDALPGRAAIGYLDDGRTNVFALPVVGSGDGGIYSTAADVVRFWRALFGGRLVPADRLEQLIAPGEHPTGHSLHYGRGFWLDPTLGLVVLEGCDHGVSFRSIHDQRTSTTRTVIATTTDGAWPTARRLQELAQSRPQLAGG
jgi:CubicO group peptidase (beta-lactamase class C family)